MSGTIIDLAINFLGAPYIFPPLLIKGCSVMIEPTQQIQFDFVKSINIDKTNAWIQNLTNQKVNEFANNGLDPDTLSKFFELPPIENPLGEGRIWDRIHTRYNTPVWDTWDAISHVGYALKPHILLAAILIDKGKTVIATDEQEALFMKIMRHLYILDYKVAALRDVATIFLKHVKNSSDIHKMKRIQIFALDVLFKHVSNIGKILVISELTALPKWWSLNNKVFIQSRNYLACNFDAVAQCIMHDLHDREELEDMYPEVSDYTPDPAKTLLLDLINDSHHKSIYKKTLASLKSVKVCPEVLNTFPGLSLSLSAKPKSANKKAHHGLLEQLRSKNFIVYKSLLL